MNDADRLAAVDALHSEQPRYWTPGYEDYSYETVEDLRDSLYDDDDPEEIEIRTFGICAECARIELSGEDFVGYRESIWPCATHVAVHPETQGSGS